MNSSLDLRSKALGLKSVDALLPKQPEINSSMLACAYRGLPLSVAQMDRYNAYTRKFNESVSRSDQEAIQNRRHEFYAWCCQQNDQSGAA